MENYDQESIVGWNFSQIQSIITVANVLFNLAVIFVLAKTLPNFEKNSFGIFLFLHLRAFVLIIFTRTYLNKNCKHSPPEFWASVDQMKIYSSWRIITSVWT